MKTKSRHLICAVAMIGLVVLPFMWISVSSAQGPTAHIRMVRALKTSKLGIQNPVGLAFSMNEEVFHVVASPGMSEPPPAVSDIIMVTARSDQKGSARIPAAINDPINMAFDNRCDCLLILQPNANGLIQVKAGPDGRLIPGTLVRFDARPFGLLNPQGMAVDPASGDLFILDSTAAGLVRVARAPDGSFDENGVSRVDLRHLGSVGLRGLAIDPINGHLHVLDSTKQALYEITPAGQVLAARDLASLNLNDPRGMVFAPSGDQTDDPMRMSLYLADSGLGSARGSRPRGPGQIVELSLAAPTAPAASSFQSSLVRTTDMAASSFFPPSPDPSGLTYVAPDRLLMSDGEVEEIVSGITHFQGANVWEMTLSGGVVRTANISKVAPTVVPMTDEPTGVAFNPGNGGHYYFTDDSARKVFDLNPGTDGQIGTADDSWTSFDTLGAGNGDPEGITYDALHDRLFVVDGVNMEVYEYTTAGALVSQFDVQAYGVVDPESVEFNLYSGTLYVLSNAGSPIIIETTTSGALLQTIDVSAANAIAPAGLAYAPASSGSGAKHFYIVDRGIDNNIDPTIIDGKMYEMTSPSITEANHPPAVYAGVDQTVTLSQGAPLQGTASDVDGLPTWGTLTVTWSKASGPGTVTFSNANDINATASFSSIGNYVLRLIADDGDLVASDDVNVNVTGDNGELLIEVRVAASADDAEESATGSMSLPSSDLELVFDGSNQTVGMRFNEVAIPRGATVTSAYVQFKVDEVNSESTFLTIQGENVDQAAQFTALKKSISSRSRTAAAASWSPNPWTTVGAIGADQQTPDIASVIQEIVNRPGWASGNSLAIIITGTGHRTAESFDGDQVGAPLLHIEFLAPLSNHAPVANAQSVTTAENTAKAITLTASDVDGDTLTYSVVTGPTHGALSGTAPALTYTPAANYKGADSFTFKANDGKLDSATATVTITVTAVNRPPVANAQSVTTAEDTAIAITLTASDPDGDTLTYSVVTGPAHGALTGTAPNLTYTPVANYNSSDSFTFKANDGKLDSATATVSITVTPVNDAPVANVQSVTTAQDAPKAVTLTASDVDGDALTYILVALPAHGTLGGTAPNLTYTPAVNYNGPDSFTFKANDGTVDSNVATVSITVTPLSNAPVPTISSLSPSSATAGAAVGFTLTVNGSGFVTYSVVRWNGVDHPTSFVSSTRLTATISTLDIAVGKSVAVTVYTPPPGGGTSNAKTFTVNNPVPATIGLSPATATAGDPAFTLTVTGTNFVSSSVVRWNGSSRTSTFSPPNQLSAAISASDIASGKTVQVTVYNPKPGGGTSNAQTFTVNNPVPTITSLSPATAYARGAAFTLTVNGTGFATNSIIRWNDTDHSTVYSSSTKVKTTISTADLGLVAGPATVTVFTPAPGGGLSYPQTFTVNDPPAPTISSLSPSSSTAGGADFTLTVNGSGFVTDSKVLWKGAERATTLASSTRLTAVIPAADVAVAGTALVSVFTPTPGGGTSNAKTFTINNPVPTIASLNPATASAGGPGFTLAVSGGNFVTGSVVRWNGSSRTTTVASSTQLTAEIPASDIASAGTALVTVLNPTPGGGTSTAQSFTITP